MVAAAPPGLLVWVYFVSVGFLGGEGGGEGGWGRGLTAGAAGSGLAHCCGLGFVGGDGLVRCWDGNRRIELGT